MKKYEQNVITAEAFDVHFAPENRTDQKITDSIWGAKAIGRSIGRSPDFVRNTLAKLPGSPVRRLGRQLYVSAAELREFIHPPTNAR